MSPDERPPLPTNPLADRLMRVEESVAFGQHEQEQLSAEIAAMGRRLAELTRRLDALEQREAARQAGEDESPETE